MARLRDRLIGLDVLELNEAERRCVPQCARRRGTTCSAARRVFGGVEMALWDARGRAQGVPLSLLLGGAVRAEVALTEYFSYRLAGPSYPGESTPLEVARHCARMIEEHGAGPFEGKVCTVSLEEEIQMVREVRAAIGESRRLTLDANGGWTVPTAREAIRRLDRYNIHYYEDPVETPEELAQLRSHTAASFSSHVVDLEQGHRAARARRDRDQPERARRHPSHRRVHRRVCAFRRRVPVPQRGDGHRDGCLPARLGAVEHVREASQTLVRWYADDVIAGGPFAPRNGVLAVPSGPGLGVTLDPDALRRCHERFLREGPVPLRRLGRRLRQLVPATLTDGLQARGVPRHVAVG